jgi:hypothetical protein
MFDAGYSIQNTGLFLNIEHPESRIQNPVSTITFEKEQRKEIRIHCKI